MPTGLFDFFKQHPKVALAFSGGVDSSYLLYAAKKAGADVQAYYVNAQFQPQFELEDAKKLAKQVKANLKIIPVDILNNEEVVLNPENRCYFCKQGIFGTILKNAQADGYTTIIDGTNASDDVNDRPGMKALQEMNVYSPLRLCGITKKQVRKYSQEAQLFTWNKPSYACLATRIPTGTAITQQRLNKVERCEDILFELGFTNFRVRLLDDKTAKIQLTAKQFSKMVDCREQVVKLFEEDFEQVVLDMQVRG